jgi:hypothetical protein
MKERFIIMYISGNCSLTLLLNKHLLIIALFVLSFNAFASGDSGWRNIINVKIEGKNFVAVYSDNPWLNPDSCGKSNLAIVPLTDEAYREKLSVALSAFMGGKRLALWLTGCQQSPWGYTVPVIYTMTIGN